eukprot:Plantae.Rhodophyta-Purpureofilum_apyrenoidigerum.ctg23719.p1 GENE.Plantae.Rhodophyta-Purpureofilum_apyrenoidigerum.ctg23719~~Plantae.Rhodophyta-Purpureofilum_apyrenoidigerum.ctg23719.p1  ORF type:complete len:219 (-),score=35.30 Plantae.Rhodophyta-Purpureofilum_apyrenoidigerum.ctg23719:209-865(-)
MSVLKMSKTRIFEQFSRRTRTCFLSNLSKARIYTRTGDKGHSSLFNGERRSKDDAVFEALGNLDVSNAQVGLAREHLTDKELRDKFALIQSALFDAGAAVATPRPTSSEARLKQVAFDASKIRQLERWIDELDAVLPPLRKFILPGGGTAAANVHVARTAVRTAERRVFSLVHDDHVDETVGQYLNRLGDFLFVAARYISYSAKIPEVEYRKEQTSTS